ncbi:MAG TPA: DUF4302 domain-containing protein, partial [Puia sp.]|nr:DUF4302 domain-containing protein [Puia sp.]
MKRIIIYMLVVMMVGAGCRKTTSDTIGGETPDQRIAKALAAYQSKLMSAPYGWILYEKTTGIAYNQGVSQNGPAIELAYYVQFADSNTVVMFSDFDTSMTVAKSSSYRIKELTRPALIFDTYSYLHVPCDPDPAISKSPFGTGYGWGTDFEFSFSDSTVPTEAGDTVRLLGNLNGASGLLVKATQAQRDAYYSGAFRDNSSALLNILEYFKRMTVNGVAYDLRTNADRSITITWTVGAQTQSQTSSYYIASTGIIFTNPIAAGGVTISSIDNLVWNAGTQTITASVGGQSATIKGATAPAHNDVNAPSRWWHYADDNGYYWASWNGWHIDGTDDAYGVTNVTDAGGFFYQLAYIPNLLNPQNSGITADAFTPLVVANNALEIGDYFTAPATPPSFTGG